MKKHIVSINILLFSLFNFIFSQDFYNVELDPAGEYQLVLFEESISFIEPGDEIGIFDMNGVVESCFPDNDCFEPTYGEVLIGSGVWDSNVLDVTGIMSIDLSDFNGPILNGAIEGNEITIKVFKQADQTEYNVSPTWSTGSGIFGELILAVSELEIIEEVEVSINEFFFRSQADVPDYVELVNNGDSDVDLTGWTLMGEELSGTISAGGYMLVAGEDPFYNIDGDEFYTGDNLPNSIFADISLSTNSDEIDLLDAMGIEVDYVAYDGDTGWPVGNANKGHAVELKNPALDNSDPTNWLSAGDDCLNDYMYNEDGELKILVHQV